MTRTQSVVFGMVTTSASQSYTDLALDSFFMRTVKLPTDKFILIDNDCSYTVADRFKNQIEHIKNAKPQSFAHNINLGVELARKSSLPLVFLNNDIVLSDNWLQPLLQAPAGIASPLCNQQVQGRKGEFVFARAMKLQDYLGHEADFDDLSKQQNNQQLSLIRVLSLPFFCVRISLEVMQVIGSFDESFGIGGAEDNDYCLRAALAGFPCHFLRNDLVLHFSGKSTWSGAESEAQSQNRVERFRQRFEQKWGARLLRLIIDFDGKVIEGQKYQNFLQHGAFKDLIEGLLKEDGLSAPSIKI